MVKNVAFECTANELRELFKAYGTIKQIRLPKKANNNNHRGFGFVEYASKDEAMAAKRGLSDTHLYARKLVIEFAKVDKALDAALAK